jgi:hypothetical protein
MCRHLILLFYCNPECRHLSACAALKLALFTRDCPPRWVPGHMEIYHILFPSSLRYSTTRSLTPWTVCCPQDATDAGPPIMAVPEVSGHANVAACRPSTQQPAAPPSSSVRLLPAPSSTPNPQPPNSKPPFRRKPTHDRRLHSRKHTRAIDPVPPSLQRPPTPP